MDKKGLFYIVLLAVVVIAYQKSNKVKSKKDKTYVVKERAMDEKKKIQEVTPTEDLMREHGILNRVLLIYNEILERLRKNKPFEVHLLDEAATIIQDFIENYHEKSEENYIFPLFEKAKVEVELVKVLREQHQAGRMLTATIKKLVTKNFKDTQVKEQLIQAIGGFICMYRPHEAREDTVLFSQVRNLISAEEFDKIGENFEETEHQVFGKEGFEGIVSRVAALEKALGLYDLAQFTPLKPGSSCGCYSESCINKD